MPVAVTAFADWERWTRQGMYTTLPLLHKLPLPAGTAAPASWEEAWKSASAYAFVLESGKDGRYTYLGLRPASVVQGKGLDAESVDTATGETRRLHGKPLEIVRNWMSASRAPRVADGPKWTGGCAGFWSYDVIRTIERLPELAEDDLGIPDYLFMHMDEVWIVDREEQALYCAVHTAIAPEDAASGKLKIKYDAACARAERMEREWLRFTDAYGEPADEAGHPVDRNPAALRREFLERQPPSSAFELPDGIYGPFAREDYMRAVERIREYIAQGDVFQVNLSLRQSRSAAASPEELYEWLRLVNPSPYMGFLRSPDFQLVSGSPELLVELQGGKLATRPIAGTRRRGRTPEEDRLMEEELRTSEKERAEHIMLVDLERNDLGRIAAFGSVRVEELMVVERYSHVMHLVSQVEGRLAEGKDAYDVIAATFPGGTITGAPKIRTMEIIEELEPVRRGPYTGSMGWIDYNGDMEFNIVIRTMVVKDNAVHIQAGAGIVIDSVPEREYDESLNKAKALWKAIQYSEQFAAETAEAARSRSAADDEHERL
ncbi:anthranilate synthase component I family protein [Paenibacillus beijingensis]|uniref:Anthranilate synthase n=1 Tax=Paenibacillus beijingensis TaxID=1126833 RepID=A0A0D5NJ54_9BACL|nr:anthranilate synthase component I family protein [Paenibacillus beijingensis]AJY74963.1 anthranilate synthase [Paenibacillus beijingensis]